jgi:hypothetical protein
LSVESLWNLKKKKNVMKAKIILAVIAGVFIFGELIVDAQTAASQKTMLITNWIQPSEKYCLVGKQIYDKYRSPQFVTVNPPIFATVSVSYQGPVDSVVHPLVLGASWKQGGVSYFVTLRNYPFVRTAWNYNGNNLYKVGGVSAQAMLVSETPHYNTAGALLSVNQVYECGMPLTEPYPVVQRYTPLTEEQKKLLVEKQLAEKKRLAEKEKTTATKTFELLKSDAEAGSPTAQYDLAKRYLEGRGCEVDTNEAIRWLKLSASGGNAAAVKRLDGLKN